MRTGRNTYQFYVTVFTFDFSSPTACRLALHTSANLPSPSSTPSPSLPFSLHLPLLLLRSRSGARIDDRTRTHLKILICFARDWPLAVYLSYGITWKPRLLPESDYPWRVWFPTARQDRRLENRLLRSKSDLMQRKNLQSSMPNQSRYAFCSLGQSPCLILFMFSGQIHNFFC